MKLFLIAFLVLPLFSSTKVFALDRLEKAQISYLKCTRDMAKLRVDPKETMPETFKQLQVLIANKTNVPALEKGAEDCRDELLHLQQQKRLRKKRHEAIKWQQLDEMHSNPEMTNSAVKEKAYWMLRNLYAPRFIKCTIGGAVANFAVIGGAHLGLSLGVCSSTDGAKYQIFAPEVGLTLGIGAFVGVHFTTTEELDYLGRHDVISISLVGGMTMNDAYRSLGVGAGAIYGDATTHIFKMIRVKKNYFKPLLENLN